MHDTAELLANPRTAPCVRVHQVTSAVDAFATFLILYTRSGRPGALVLMSLADLRNTLAKPGPQRIWTTVNKGKEAVIDFTSDEAATCATLYLTQLRPYMEARAPESARTSPAAAQHAFVNRDFGPLNMSTAVQRYVSARTGKTIGITTLRALIATEVERQRHVGLLADEDADVIHRADNHSVEVARLYYAQGEYTEAVLRGNRLVTEKIGLGCKPRASNQEGVSIMAGMGLLPSSHLHAHLHSHRLTPLPKLLLNPTIRRAKMPCLFRNRWRRWVFIDVGRRLQRQKQ